MNNIDFSCHYISRKEYDLYYGNGAIANEAIIYCHGGAFRYGKKSENSEFLATLAEKMSMRVYSVDFRNIDEARSLKVMIDDIVDSINRIVEQDSITRFHIMGSSSGAYLVWIMSIMLANPEKFCVKANFDVESLT